MQLSTKDKMLMLVIPIGSAFALYGALASKFSWWPF